MEDRSSETLKVNQLSATPNNRSFRQPSILGSGATRDTASMNRLEVQSGLMTVNYRPGTLDVRSRRELWPTPQKESLMETQMLVQLPTEKTLMRQVHEALHEIAGLKWHDITHDGIASALAKRLKENPKVFCYGGRRHTIPVGCDGPEFLFDFCALLYEKPDAEFWVQAVVVGETEWDRRGTDDDFEKLLIVDSIICFFVFEEDSDEKANEKLKRYEEVARVREEYAKMRGAHPPRFLLACYVKPNDAAPRPKLITREV